MTLIDREITEMLKTYSLPQILSALYNALSGLEKVAITQERKSAYIKSAAYVFAARTELTRIQIG